MFILYTITLLVAIVLSIIINYSKNRIFTDKELYKIVKKIDYNLQNIERISQQADNSLLLFNIIYHDQKKTPIIIRNIRYFLSLCNSYKMGLTKIREVFDSAQNSCGYNDYIVFKKNIRKVLREFDKAGNLIHKDIKVILNRTEAAQISYQHLFLLPAPEPSPEPATNIE